MKRLWGLELPKEFSLKFALCAVWGAIFVRNPSQRHRLEPRVNSWQQMAVVFVAMAVSGEYDGAKSKTNADVNR